jgi:hypothetical protein
MNFISLFSSFVFLCVNFDVVGAVGLMQLVMEDLRAALEEASVVS